MRFNLVFTALFLAVAAADSQTIPSGAKKGPSIEGVTEYDYPNGLRVLLCPDNSKAKITVNIVYLVGSRNEGYGETGMAHLLEHMLFKSATNGREVRKELTDRVGAGNFNGATSYDQTIYFETMAATDENLRWALSLEADRMVRMTMLKKDLDTEMTVVRNEMESGENSPLDVLQERTIAAAYSFHNYGKTVIGNRTDVERVPIENLAVFYRKYYQPDDAMVIVAGQIDQSKTLAMVSETLGAVPRPTRILQQPYTSEPTQEGERAVTLRRVGEVQGIIAVYHVPAALHPDSAALEVLAQVLGAPQTGRLYKALVDNKEAVQTGMFDGTLHDPGFTLAYAQLKPDQHLDAAQQTLLKTVEDLAAEPPSEEEVERAKTRLLKNIGLNMANSQSVAMALANSAGVGDWRDFYLNRDEIQKVKPADVERVAKNYLKSSNRTLGEFIPTKAPDRAEIPVTPDPGALFKDYKGGAAIQEGEAFEPTPKNIESRVIRLKLPNGLKLAMFPKKTRGGIVAMSMSVEFGDGENLFGKSITGQFTSMLLMRGTLHKSRQQIQDETDRLRAQINVFGGPTMASATARTTEANLPDTLRFVHELLTEPSFPEGEFEQIRQQRIATLESQKTEPNSLAPLDLNEHINARYPHGDVRHPSTIDEQIEDAKKVTLDDVRAFHKQFYGVADGEIGISGQFDPAAIQKLVAELFGNWKSAAHYERISNMYSPVDAINHKIETPDRQNALFAAAAATKINDDSPDYPALLIAGVVFGGSPNSRLFLRIRVKDGLSYGANGGFSIPTKDDGGRFSASAIAAPQNMPRVEADFNEEVAKALKDGFTADEVEKAKKTWLDERAVARTEEASIASLLTVHERWNRTFDWDVRLEAAVSAITLAQVNEAFRKYLDPAAISIVKAGDFQKSGAYK